MYSFSVVWLVIICALLPGSLLQSYNPLKDPNKCGLPTCPETNKFKYGPTTQQTYRYTVQVRTLFNGTSSNESTLYVEASAQFSFPTPCEGILSLYDVKLSETIPREASSIIPEHHNGELFAEDLSRSSLRFSFRNGQIGELCPSQELEWTLNFKRGVLNMMHNTMKRFDLDYYTEDEEDIRGRCTTQYRVIGAKETSLLVEKSKNLTTCLGSGRVRSEIQTEALPFFHSTAKKANILQSSSSCLLSIDHNVYNQITCEESHLLKPLSNYGAGATTSIRQELILQEESPTQTHPPDEEIETRVSLAFDYSPPTKPKRDDWAAEEVLLEQLCELDGQTDQKDVSDVFNRLVYGLKELSVDAMSEVFEKSNTVCPKGRKHFLDALPFANTGPSVTLMKNLINGEKVPDSTADEWLTSVAFIPEPDEEILNAASQILIEEERNFRPQVVLKVAALIHTFCQGKDDCVDVEAVGNVVGYLERRFLKEVEEGDEKREVYDAMMISLKSLSTIGLISEDFQSELFRLIESTELDSGIRVAAVEVFRRISCHTYRPYFQKIFIDQNQDSEVRIASYLQIMRCPDYLMMQVVKKALMEEEVNQVGSFVWSYLKNLLKSTIPTKVEIQSLLSEKDLVKKFESDVRKFSRNYEGSLYFDNYNVGGSFESNIIFSPSSYIPKSAMLNFSTVVFGESINFLEVYGRLDGFEKYLQSLLGGNSFAKDLSEGLMDKLRFTRGAENKNSTLMEKVEELPDVTSDFAAEPKAILGMKVFGNDLNYASFYGRKEIWDAVQKLDPRYHLTRILSGKEIMFDKSVMFLDSKFVMATGAGLPLALSATGTSSVNVRISGSLRSNGKSKTTSMDLSADIRPTASVDVSADMSCDAFYADAGVRLKVGVYTDSAVKAVFKIRGADLVSANFSLPKENNEIFAARSEILLKKHGRMEPQRGISDPLITISACSWSPIERTFGLKLCSDYTYASTPHPENPFFFLLTSPTTVKCSLLKSDKTADVYLFQYKKSRIEDKDVMSVTFDTPGSKIRRLLSSNLTVSEAVYDLIVSAESSEGVVVLSGELKRNPEERLFKVALDVDGKRTFESEASLKITNIRNGVSFKPVVYVNVNGQNILRSYGYVDFVSKRGIGQYTVQLKFETKRLTSKLFGYISTGPSSLEASLYTDYKFQHTQEHRLTLKFGLANKSRRNIVVLVGFCNFISTAYPNLNLDANVTFQRSGSHMDLSLKLQQCPLAPDHFEADFRSLKFDLLLSYKTFTDNKRTLSLESSVSRRSSNLDLKGSILYETFRHNVNVLGSVKYSKDKETLVTVFWSHPRTLLEEIKLHVNVTVPSFKPMVFKIELDEKEPRYYMVDFYCTWFSGHSMSAVGFYNDKSKPTSSHRHVKLMLRSPSFKDIQLDVFFYRDNEATKLNVEAIYDETDDYQIVFAHQLKSEFETYTIAYFKYKNKTYQFVSSIYDGNHKKIDVELHMDQLRDIRFRTYLLNEPNNKTVEFEVNWDANRDPNQKLMAALNYRKNNVFDYGSNFIVSYPGRTVKGDYKFLLERGHVETLMGLSWEEGKTLAVNLDVRYENEDRLFLDIKSQVNTPIENWKTVKFLGSFEHLRSKYEMHGLLSWDRRKKIVLEVFSDYETTLYDFWCRHSGSVTSTVDAVPNVNVSLWHKQNDTNLMTNLHLMYNPEFLVDLDSKWHVDTDAHHKNLTGTITSKTPYEGFREGFLHSKLSLRDSKYLKGVAELDIDHRKAWADLEGSFRRLTDCSLIVNASMLEDEYQLRFIVSAEKKHLVAMLSYPGGNFGTEVLLDVRRITDFDVKLQLATPIEFLQNIIVVSKLKEEMADFRVGWNVLLLGVSGVWHYKDLTDFHYEYRVFTPLRDYEENYVVGKLILNEGFDFEIGVKLSLYKLGLRLIGEDKPRLFKGIDTDEGSSSSDELSWKGLVEVDVLIYPTMKGVLEVDQKGAVYAVYSKLTMPNGEAVLINEFEYINVYKMRNNLKITSPFVMFKSIASNYELDIIPEKKYIFGLNFDYQNASKLIQTGVYVKYESDVKESYEKKYNVILNVKTPFESFPMLDAQGAFKSEEDFYHTQLMVKTMNSDVAVDASTEIDNDLLEFSSSFHVVTPTIYIPSSRLRLSKLFGRNDNYLEANLNCPEKLQSDVYLKLSWLVKSRTEFRALVELETPFSGLEKTKASTDVYLSNVRSSIAGSLQLTPIAFAFNSTLIGDNLKTISYLDFNGKRYPMVVDCTINKTNGKHDFGGTVKFSDKSFKVTGTGTPMGTIYSSLYITLTPDDRSAPVEIKYRITPNKVNEYGLDGSVSHDGRSTDFNATLAADDWFNWVLSGQMYTFKGDRFVIDAKMKSDKDSIDLNVDANTPILRLEQPHIEANYKSSGFQKNLYASFVITEAKGSGTLSVIWNFLENMYVKAVGEFETDHFVKKSSLKAFYENPEKTFYYLSAGGDVYIDTFWEASSNVTLKLPPTSSIGLEGHIMIPDGDKETHSLYATMDYTGKLRNINYLLRYRTDLSKKKYGSLGKILTLDMTNLTGDVEIEWNGNKYINFVNLERIEESFNVLYKLKTPKYIDKKFVVGSFKYKPVGDRYNVTCSVFYPENNPLSFLTVDFKGLTNMKGMFNTTVPHKGLNYTGAYFDFKTTSVVKNRYIKSFWQGNYAILDSICDIINGPTLLDSNTKGRLILVVPLKTKHTAQIAYEYDKKGQISKGTADVSYNKANILEGKYQCDSQSRAGLDKDIVHVELKNKFFPLGADYIHSYEYGSSPDDDTTENRHLHLFHLTNRTKFSITGELEVHNVWTGQEYILTINHNKKTVKIFSDYNIFDQIYKQHSRVELSDTHWLEYDLSLVNRTQDKVFDVQEAIINVYYPKRNFTTNLSYNVSEDIVKGTIMLEWDERVVQTVVDWRKNSLRRDQLSIQMKHPTFEKEVLIFSEYGYERSVLDGLLTVDYSLDPSKKLTLKSKLVDNSDLNAYNYTGNLWTSHDATNLRMDSGVKLYWNRDIFGVEQITKYKRSYLPESTSETFVKFMFEDNEVELKKDTIATGYSYFWGKYDGSYPIYRANMRSVYDMVSKEGESFLDFKQKLTYVNMNLTEDGTQRLHLYGTIPDARTVLFDVWRDYDDRRVTDVSYFLKLNHSRLIMSNLKWRPELYSDIQSTIRGSLMKFYLDTLEGVNNTRHYIKSETVDAVNGVWLDARPLVHGFLEDLRNITVIEDDLDDFKTFMNASYHNNDFYIRDIVNITLTMMDELAIKSQLQTLPKIVQEIWSLMGESGTKIKKSIHWVIGEIMVYYKNTTDFIHGLLNGDPIQHISTGLDRLVEKYDNFIKNLHVSVIQYMENLWTQTYAFMVDHWHKFLASLEPTFIKFLHYMESMAWSTGKEFLDFLYMRRTEFIESPYFVKFTKLSQDIDRFYKDVTGNNTIGAIYKYSKVGWDFVKEKYLTLIPFGKELSEVINEIITELKEVGNIPSVQYVVKKINDFYDDVRYYYDYFDVELKIQGLIRLIYTKIYDYSSNALDIENRQREAKTKFIFEPNDGIMILEQKLPMSWHAFNETPKFKEVPEIKKLYDLKDYFETSKLSFWTLYNEYKLLTHPEEWFPPFDGRAMLIGRSHLVSFDGKHYDLRGSCTYLLTSDFSARNFTLLASYDTVGSVDELIVLLKKTTVRIRLVDDRVIVDNGKVESLPAQIGDVLLYRCAGKFVMEANTGFKLECNLKFRVCTFEISGWYFGKTAGLWGTNNNEPSDDFILGNSTRTKDLRSFADTWSLDKSCRTKLLQAPKKASQEVIEVCEEFFVSKVSELSDCFEKIPTDEFLGICMESGSREEACTSAVAYITACGYVNMPLRIPESCVRCTLSNGTEVKEGEFIRYQGDNVLRQADVVFIVEAKDCNSNLRESKNFDLLIDSLEKELIANNITENRYALVTFGGNGVLDQPRSVIIDGKAFTNSKSFGSYFDKIVAGKGNSDIFGAIMFAYDLRFRPGASRNFILVPCTDCKSSHMEYYDYSTVHQFLSEGAVSLHILMNNYFTMQKQGEVRLAYGIDRRLAYTKRDIRTLTGDQSLRKSIQLPKASLGLCLSLAIETNGTVFSKKFLETERKNAKKFATVQAQLVARSAVPEQCVDCECTAEDSGISYMECYLCSMANTGRSNVEQLFTFEDEDAINTMNMLEGFSLGGKFNSQD